MKTPPSADITQFLSSAGWRLVGQEKDVERWLSPSPGNAILLLPTNGPGYDRQIEEALKDIAFVHKCSVESLLEAIEARETKLRVAWLRETSVLATVALLKEHGWTGGERPPGSKDLTSYWSLRPMTIRLQPSRVMLKGYEKALIVGRSFLKSVEYEFSHEDFVVLYADILTCMWVPEDGAT